MQSAMSLWFTEQFQRNFRIGVRVRETLYTTRSEFQKIDIFESEALGRMLALDGIFMTSEVDEFFYHEMLVHPAIALAPKIERVLIIGGGDGGTAREVLRHDDVKTVVLAEIDGKVIEACKKYLPTIGTAWDDPRLDVRVIDGIDFVKEKRDEPFDVIFLDGSDPVGPAEGLFNKSFFEGVRSMLKPDGLFACQSESPLMMDDIFIETQRTLRSVFSQVNPYFGCVPIYGCGTWSWTLCGNQFDPKAIHPDRANTIAKTAKLWSPSVHLGAFDMPGYVQEKLKKV